MRRKRPIQNAMFVVMTVALLMAAPAVLAQGEPMRPNCDVNGPGSPGACFDTSGGVGTFIIVDADGDAFQGWINPADINDFFITRPNGSVFLHFQGPSVSQFPADPLTGLFACRAGDFPACAGPGNPGLLVGSGNLLLAGGVDNPINLGLVPPFTVQATGSLADFNTGAEFSITVSWVIAANGQLTANDIKIRTN